MKMFVGVIQVYLYCHVVDFRKAINGLSLIVEQEMGLPLFSECLFVFCNRGRDKIKILYWEGLPRSLGIAVGFVCGKSALRKNDSSGQSYRVISV